MPDYAAEIEYRAPQFAGAEFRMLSRQLVPLLEQSHEVRQVRADRAARCIVAEVVVNAPSSSTAAAKAGSLARGVQAQPRKVRTGLISLRVDLLHDEQG
jgi:hypothetical protein